MGLNANITILRTLCNEAANKPEYVPKDILSPNRISNLQKNSAKKAIVWLLSKASHSVNEIAEHFELSPELVNLLIQELVRSGMLNKDQIL